MIRVKTNLRMLEGFKAVRCVVKQRAEATPRKKVALTVHRDCSGLWGQSTPEQLTRHLAVTTVLLGRVGYVPFTAARC